MLSESRKRKLSMLARSIAEGDFAKASELLTAHGHAGVNRGQAGPQAVGKGPLPLIQAAPGGGETTFDVPAGPGRCWLISRTLSEVCPDEAAIAREFSTVLRGARHRFDELGASPALCHVANARPEDLLFMDTETCGLAGSAVFLVGLMFYQEDELVFHQYLARDYAEEAAILQAFADRLGRAGILVTFNGKAFDMTLLSDRSAFHGVALARGEIVHLDLLHEARRLWRGHLPNCRLQTLERHFCNRVRAGDIPGSAIPDAYHNFVATADARQMRDILHHNLLDLLTMAQLICAMLTGCDISDP